MSTQCACSGMRCSVHEAYGRAQPPAHLIGAPLDPLAHPRLGADLRRRSSVTAQCRRVLHSLGPPVTARRRRRARARARARDRRNRARRGRGASHRRGASRRRGGISQSRGWFRCAAAAVADGHALGPAAQRLPQHTMVTIDDLEEAARAQAPLGTGLEHAGHVELRRSKRGGDRRIALEELGGQPAPLVEPTASTRLRGGESGELLHGCLRCRDGQTGSLEAPPDEVTEGRRH